MSNFPSCLSTTKPSTSIVLQGDELTSAQVAFLRTQLRSLHFHPIIVVLPKHYKVKNGDAMVEEVAKQWGLGPHGMLIVYSPADKSVYAICGDFNTKAGVDVQFFKRDFSQRMPADAQEDNLFAALNASLQDVDRIIIRSDAYINRHATSQVSAQPAAPEHSQHAKAPVSTILFLVLGIVFVGIVVSQQPGRRRMRLSNSAGLDHDLARINRLTGAQLDQVPMAEFKKRAHSGGAVRRTRDNLDAIRLGGHQQSDPAADFQSAIDVSAAQARLDAREHALNPANQPVSADTNYSQQLRPSPDPDVYVATFGSDDAATSTITAASELASSSNSSVVGGEAPNVVPQADSGNKFTFPDAPGGVFPDAPYPTDPQAVSALDAAGRLSVNATVRDMSNTPSSVVSSAASQQLSIFNPGTTGGEEVDPLATPSGAADQFNSSFSSQLFSTVSTPTAVVAGLSSPGAESAESSCPKCGEPKSKDFSFCIKCGHLYL